MTYRWWSICITFFSYILLGVKCTITLSCRFNDSTMCNFKQAVNKVGYWTWGNGSGPNRPQTGPTSAYGGTGGYAFLNSANITPNGLIEMVSPAFSAGSKCVQFFYYMYGQDLGSLELFQVNLNSKDSIWIITKQGADGEDEWKQVQVPLTPDTRQIVVTGKRGAPPNYTRGAYVPPRADIAVDEITVATVECGANSSDMAAKDLSAKDGSNREREFSLWLLLLGFSIMVEVIIFSVVI